jgi:hypothetical protein
MTRELFGLESEDDADSSSSKAAVSPAIYLEAKKARIELRNPPASR